MRSKQNSLVRADMLTECFAKSHYSHHKFNFFTIGNHTVAIIKGQESYELLERSCSKIFTQVNSLVEKKTVTVNGAKIPVELYLGGNYKVNISSL